MNKNKAVKEPKGKPGPKPKPEEEQCRLGRFMVNIQPKRIPQLKRIVDSQGLSIAAFLRLAVYNKLDEIDRAA